VRAMKFATPGPIPEDQPFAAPNTTPLIDVMLVLLIMMIITLPATLHKMPVDLPQAAKPGTPPPVHSLVLASSGALSLDGMSIDRSRLTTELTTFIADPAQPVLQLQTDPAARYEDFNATLAIIKRAGITKLGFVGNDAMRSAI
jgi:biopolymer transport protein ExbD